MRVNYELTISELTSIIRTKKNNRCIFFLDNAISFLFPQMNEKTSKAVDTYYL